MATRVRQYTLKGLFVNEYGSIKEAAEKTKCPAHQISKCVNSDSLSSYGGYIWTACWRDDRLIGMPLFVKPTGVGPCSDRRSEKARGVRQYTRDGKFVAVYRTVYEPGRQSGSKFKAQGIVACCNRSPKFCTYKGFIWRYVDDDEFNAVQSK